MARDQRKLSFAPHIVEVPPDESVISQPFAWVNGGSTGLNTSPSHKPAPGPRRSSRSGSIALQKYWRSESIGMPQALKGVTAYHDAGEIGSALQKCAEYSRDRLKSIGEISLAYDIPDEAGSEMSDCHSLPDADLEMIKSELQDRDEQLLQAVQLGQGLLDQLNDVRYEASQNEESLQKKIDSVTEEMQKQNSEMTKYRTSLMYLLNVEEELINKTLENDTLQSELHSVSVRASDTANIAWLEKKMLSSEKDLALREKINMEQSEEVTMKLRELNNWKAKSARTSRYENEMLSAQKELREKEKEIHRLKRLLTDRDNTVYGLREQLSSQRDQWNRASCEATIARLKRESVVMKNTITTHEECLSSMEHEVKHYKGLSEKLAARTKNGGCNKAALLSSAHYSQYIKQATEKIISEATAMKQEFYTEFQLWSRAVADISRDSRAQGEVLRRLRIDNKALRERLVAYEELDSDIGKKTARTKLVYGSQLLTKEVTFLKNFSRSIRSQAATRQITEKEVQELSSTVSNLAKHFMAFIASLLGPSEKKQLGVTPDRSDSFTPVSHTTTPTHSQKSAKPKRRATAVTSSLRCVPQGYPKSRLKMF